MFIHCSVIKHLYSHKLDSSNKGMFFNNKNTYKNYWLLLLVVLSKLEWGMLDIKYNYKNKYNSNLKCRVCNEQDESMKRFFQCESHMSHLRIDKQFTFMWIYEEYVKRKLIQIIEQIIKIRDELINKQTKTTSMDDELGIT